MDSTTIQKEHFFYFLEVFQNTLRRACLPTNANNLVFGLETLLLERAKLGLNLELAIRMIRGFIENSLTLKINKRKYKVFNLLSSSI